MTITDSSANVRNSYQRVSLITNDILVNGLTEKNKKDISILVADGLLSHSTVLACYREHKFLDKYSTYIPETHNCPITTSKEGTISLKEMFANTSACATSILPFELANSAYNSLIKDVYLVRVPGKPACRMRLSDGGVLHHILEGNLRLG
jgi:hypothetical protein